MNSTGRILRSSMFWTRTIEPAYLRPSGVERNNGALPHEYTLPRDASVILTVYTLNGQKVETLIRGQQNVGFYDVEWNGTDRFGNAVSSGVYFYRLSAGEFVDVKKMVRIE